MGNREDELSYQRNFEAGLFRSLVELTKDFPFSEQKDDPQTESKEKLHESRLKSLIRSVRLDAMKAFRQMPDGVCMGEGEKDWIQEAVMLLYSLSLVYRPKPGYFYDVYIKSIMPLRLVSKQRAAFRKNPAADEPLRRIVHSLKQAGQEVTAQILAIAAKISIEAAQDFLNKGAHRRMFESVDDISLYDTADESLKSSPEKIYLRKEFIRILFECLEQLQPFRRWIVFMRYFEGESFVEIARNAGEEVEAVRAQARAGFNALRSCVLNRYQISLPV